MKLISQVKPLPGITDNNHEIIVNNNDLYLLHENNQIPFGDWPEWIRVILLSELKNDMRAQISLDDMGIIDEEQRLITFTYCNYGGYDNKPDFENGVLNREYWNCGYRGTCKHEGQLCQLVKCKNGVLSPRETEVLKLIEQGYQNKEIAEMLNISEFTINNHRANISAKTGLQNRTELAHFAREKNIVK